MTQPNQDPLTVLAQALHGEIHDGHAGPYVLAPGHSPDDRSLSVSLSATAPDGLVVFSHCGNDWRECRDHVRAALNGEPLPDGPVQPAKQHKKGNWKSVWFRAKNPLHHIPRGKRRPEQKSPVELYLNSRGLELTTAIADEVVRFDPACRFEGETHPAMICLVRDIFTNAGIGLQRLALTDGGQAVMRNGKKLRMSLGKIAGGAIKLDDDSEVTTGLCIGEGVETCLSARQKWNLAPVWSAVTAAASRPSPCFPE